MKLGNKKSKLILASVLVLVGVQGFYNYEITQENDSKSATIKKLNADLEDGNAKINELQRMLNDTENSFKEKDKEAQELKDKLKKEQDNIKKIKVELKDALAKKKARLDKQYAVNNDSQEVPQSDTSYSNVTSNVSTSSGSPSGRTFTVEATAYDGYGMGGMTASGVRINSQSDKVIAVDPSVIPLGSRVYVEGYGEAIAADTGGAIKGNIIDLNMSHGEAIAWGRRPVNITVLD